MKKSLVALSLILLSTQAFAAKVLHSTCEVATISRGNFSAEKTEAEMGFREELQEKLSEKDFDFSTIVDPMISLESKNTMDQKIDRLDVNAEVIELFDGSYDAVILVTEYNYSEFGTFGSDTLHHSKANFATKAEAEAYVRRNLPRCVQR